MEYLCFSNGSLSSAQATHVFNSKRLGHWDAKACVFAGSTGLICSSEVAFTPDSANAVFGSVFLNDSFTSQCSDRSDDKILEIIRRLDRSLEAATGTYTALRIDRNTGDVTCYLDDMNAAPCFAAEAKGQFAFSNNIHMVADWLKAQQVVPSRSVEPFLSHAVFSSGLTTGSLFTEIRTLRAEEKPAVHKGRLVIEQNPQIWPDLLSASFDDLIFELAKRIRTRMQILSAIGDDRNRVVDITGGMDSRMILSALIGARQEHNWHFNTLFSVPNPDAHFAQFIGEKWGMRQMELAHGSGGRLGPKTHPRFQLYASMGTEPKGSIQPHLFYPDLVHVHGGFGELGGKSQDSVRFGVGLQSNASVETATKTYLDAIRLPPQELGFSEATMDWARKNIQDEIEKSMARLDDMTQMPVIFYRRGKARSHFGLGSHLRQMGSHAPDVLADPYLTAAALRTGADKRGMGYVNFCVARMLAGDEIAALPLANARWKPAMFDRKEDAETFSKPPITMMSDLLFHQEREKHQTPPPEVKQLREELWAEEDPHANIKISDLKIENLRGIRIAGLIETANDLLHDGPVSDAVTQYLPKSSIQKLSQLVPSECGDDPSLLNALQFLCQAEMWIRGMEERPFSD